MRPGQKALKTMTAIPVKLKGDVVCLLEGVSSNLDTARTIELDKARADIDTSLSHLDHPHQHLAGGLEDAEAGLKETGSVFKTFTTSSVTTSALPIEAARDLVKSTSGRGIEEGMGMMDGVGKSLKAVTGNILDSVIPSEVYNTTALLKQGANIAGSVDDMFAIDPDKLLDYQERLTKRMLERNLEKIIPKPAVK